MRVKYIEAKDEKEVGKILAENYWDLYELKKRQDPQTLAEIFVIHLYTVLH